MRPPVPSAPPAAARLARSPARLGVAGGVAFAGLLGCRGEVWLHQLAGKLPRDVSARELQRGRQAFEIWNPTWRAPASWTTAEVGRGLKEAATLNGQLSTAAISRPQFDAKMGALVQEIDRGQPRRPPALAPTLPALDRSAERAPSVLRPPGERSNVEPSRPGAVTGEPARHLEDAYRQRIAEAADWVREQSRHFPLLRAATQALIEEAARRFELSNLDFVARALDARASAVQAEAMGRVQAGAGQGRPNRPIGAKYLKNMTPIDPAYIELMNTLMAAGKGPAAQVVPALLLGLEESITQAMMAVRVQVNKRGGEVQVTDSDVDAYVAAMQGIESRLPKGSGEAPHGSWNPDPALIRQYAAVGVMLKQRLPQMVEKTSPNDLADHVVDDRNLLWAFGDPGTLSEQAREDARVRMRSLLGDSTSRAEVLRYLIAVHIALTSILEESRRPDRP